MTIITKEDLRKQIVDEVIDDDGNIMGSDDEPQITPDKETQARKTTDYNARVHAQNFKNDFLGRFGFYFYESEGDNQKVVDMLAKIMYEKYKETLKHYHENPDKLKSDYELHQTVDFESQPKGSKEHDYEWAEDILKVLKPHMKDNLNEGKVVEDRIVKKDDKETVTKKDDKTLSKTKTNKIADLLKKLPTNDIDKLINLLEARKAK